MTKHDWRQLWSDIVEAATPSRGDIRDYVFLFGCVVLLTWLGAPFWINVALSVLMTWGFSELCDRIWGKQ